MGLGRRTFAPGEVLTASNVMNYLQDQAVMNFAGTAARGSAIGTAVAEGMVSYLQDTDSLQVYSAVGTASPSWRNVAFESYVNTKTGLIPIVPTSITPVSGSATLNSLGTTTFTNVTKIQLNGVFTSYTNYKIVLRISSSTGFELLSRYATSGTENTTSNYQMQLAEIYSTTFTGFRATSQTQGRFAYIGNSADSITEIVCTNPSIARTTSAFSQVGSYNSGAWIQLYDNVFYNTTIFDGINFYSNNGATFSGDVTVYGINQ